MTIDGPILNDPKDDRLGQRTTVVDEEDAALLPEGDVLGEWVRCGSRVTPAKDGKYRLEERFIRRDQDLTEIAFEKGWQEGYDEAKKEAIRSEWSELEMLRDAVILAAREGSPEKITAAIAALDAKTGYKPRAEPPSNDA